MTEIRENRRIIHEPVTLEDVGSLKCGDVFYYSGEAATGRDAVHERVSCGEKLPVDIAGRMLIHAGPIVRKDADGKYEVIALGPTTSARMEKYEYDFIKKTGVRIIAGKGRMGDMTEQACREFGAVTCVMPAGCAVVGALCIDEVLALHWDDLGMPEACWHLRTKEIGPLIVTIDTNGHNFIQGQTAKDLMYAI